MNGTLVIMGPALLASHLLRQLGALSELSPAEMERHIREDPGAYYPEYQDACAAAGAPVLSLPVWRDLCVS